LQRVQDNGSGRITNPKAAMRVAVETEELAPAEEGALEADVAVDELETLVEVLVRLVVV